MSPNSINQDNVSRIAERIVANELEFRGFRVSDLNRERTSENADLLAVRGAKTWQIQVKGASNTEKDAGWWVQYGFCNDAIIAKKEPMFNRVSSFYRADIIVLVAVKSPKDYCCLVLPAEIAERAAQVNLDCNFRTPTRKGTPKKPHKVWVYLDRIPNTRDSSKKALFSAELDLLKPYRDRWEILSDAFNAARSGAGA